MDLESLLLKSKAWLEEAKVSYALNGGLGCAAYGSTRATFDVDWIIDASAETRINAILTREGFSTLQRSENLSCYGGKLGRIDFLHMRSSTGLGILREARPIEIAGQMVPVVRPEDIIGLKVQAMHNDSARRAKDSLDIAEIAWLCRATLDEPRVRQYFVLFDREKAWDDILDALPRE